MKSAYNRNFIEFNINLESLKYLTELELDKIFSSNADQGIKAIFRAKLIEWRRAKVKIQLHLSDFCLLYSYF